MGATSEILGNSGPAHQIGYAGKLYSVRLIDQTVQSGFEKRLYEKDCLAVGIQKEQGLLSEDAYAARLTELSDRFTDGEYEMLSPRCLALLGKMSGARLLLNLLIDAPENEIFALLTAKKTEILNLIGLVIRQSFPGVDFDKTNASDSTIPPNDSVADPATSATTVTDPNADTAA